MSGSTFRISDIEHASVALTRVEKVRRGMIPIEDLDDEEILNGVVRLEDGTLPKRRTKQLPREMMDEFKSRFFARSDELLGEYLFPAIRALGGIVQDEEASASDRINAAKFIIERVRGKEVKVSIKLDDPIDRIFRDLMTSDDGLEETTITGEVLQEELE